MTEDAQTFEKFVKHWEYYRGREAKLVLEFEEMADKALIPGFNFDDENINVEEDGCVSVGWRGEHIVATAATEEREDHYLRWWKPKDNGTKPTNVEIIYPEDND
jgi:hypothetical protein